MRDWPYSKYHRRRTGRVQRGVNRSSLWSNLLSCGINGSVLKVIYNMFENGKYCVKQGQALSDLFSCDDGVRQRENLPPLLFAI